jgi:hypothetical protein
MLDASSPGQLIRGLEKVWGRRAAKGQPHALQQFVVGSAREFIHMIFWGFQVVQSDPTTEVSQNRSESCKSGSARHPSYSLVFRDRERMLELVQMTRAINSLSRS